MTPPELDQLVERIATRTMDHLTEAIREWILLGIVSYAGYRYLGWWWLLIVAVGYPLWDLHRQHQPRRPQPVLKMTALWRYTASYGQGV